MSIKHNKNRVFNNLVVNEFPTILTETSFTTKKYVNKLLFLHALGLSILLVAGALQAIAMLTTDWYVLNVNEYIPTSKGGLWSYCFISTTGYLDQYTCMKYEELPNFAVFVNQRLYTSRIILLCSGGFLAVLIFIETLGMLNLVCSKNKCKKFDEFIDNKKSRLRLTSTPTSHLNDYRTSNRNPNLNAELIQTQYELLQAKPTGFSSYMSTTLVNLVASSMAIVLQVSGFVLFDAYIKQLLSFNTVFLAYRSFSYWMVIVSIILVFFYWVFKIFTTRYVLRLNKRLIGLNDLRRFSSDLQNPQHQNGPSHTMIPRLSQQNINETHQFYNRNNDYMPPSSSMRKSYVFDMENSNDEDLASSTFSSIQNYKNYLFNENPSEHCDTRKNKLDEKMPTLFSNLFQNRVSTNDAKKDDIKAENVENSPVSVMRF